MNEIKFADLENIEAIQCVLGLNFPESATEFQKAFLTLAHLAASCRDFVLKGCDLPQNLLQSIYQLALIAKSNGEQQR